MIEYKADKWGIFFAFHLKGSVFPKSFGFALGCSVTTVTLHWLLGDYGLKDEVDIGSKGTTVCSMFTFVLGFLLVFRTQQAYSRWWEGGSLLQEMRGEWFNAYSCLVAFGNPSPDKRNEVDKFNHQVARLLSMLHAAGLAQVCSSEEKHFEIIDCEDKDVEAVRFLDSTVDSCEIALQWIQRLIGDANSKETIKVAPPILSRVYNQLGNGIVKLSRARKIAKFPIPFPFAQMVTIMLLTHWVMASVICATSIDSRVWAGVLSFAVIMSFWSMNFIALELEDPFGDDENDLPLDTMQSELNESIKALMNPQAMKPPDFNFNLAYHEEMYIRRVDFSHCHESIMRIQAERPKDAFQRAERMKADLTKKANPCKKLDGNNVPPLLAAPKAAAAKASAEQPRLVGDQIDAALAGIEVSVPAAEQSKVCQATKYQTEKPHTSIAAVAGPQGVEHATSGSVHAPHSIAIPCATISEQRLAVNFSPSSHPQDPLLRPPGPAARMDTARRQNIFDGGSGGGPEAQRQDTDVDVVKQVDTEWTYLHTIHIGHDVPRLGMEITGHEPERDGGPKCVLRLSPDSVAAKLGVVVGDILVSVNGCLVADHDRTTVVQQLKERPLVIAFHRMKSAPRSRAGGPLETFLIAVEGEGDHGIELNLDGPAPTVGAVREQSPAWRSGVAAGDVLVGIKKGAINAPPQELKKLWWESTEPLMLTLQRRPLPSIGSLS